MPYRRGYFLFYFFALIFFLGFLSGCATLPRQVIIEKKKEFLLKDLCHHYGFFWEWDHVTQTVSLKDQNNDVKLFVGSRVMFAGDKKIILSAPVEIRDSLIILPRDFLQFVIIQVKIKSKEEADYKIKKVKRIIIDAGHGGQDPGAIGFEGTHEKDIVLEIARGLKKFLEKEGFEVTLTRAEDKFLTLKERTEISAGTDADLFISVHANASLNRRARGIEVFSLKDLEEKEKSEDQRKYNEKILLKRLTGRQATEDSLAEIISDMLYVHKQAQAEVLAMSVVKESAKYAHADNRGVKYTHFYVLRNTLIPAILVEVGFLSNKQEEKSLKKALYQQRIIEGIGKGIIYYANN